MKNRIFALSLLVLAAGLVLTGCNGSSAGNAAATTASKATTAAPSVIVSSQQEGIWVSGQGKVSAAPDIAILTLGVEVQDTSVAQAQAKAADAMTSIQAVLRDSGIAAKDIQTRYFNISQVTRWDPERQESKVTGYRVTNTVTARIRNLDNVGKIIDAVAAAGGDYTRINGISFSIEDTTALLEQAREKAMADARAKAEQLARLAGVTLGSPTYISESGYTPRAPTPMIGKAESLAAGVETPISAGELEVYASVQVGYAIR